MVAGMVGVAMAAAGHVDWPLRLHLAEQHWKALPSSPTATATAACVDAGGRRCDRDKQQQHFLKGVLCAIFVGVLNGSFLVPLKYANKDVVGVEYLLSFGVGAAVLTTLVLGLYFAALTATGRARPRLWTGPGAGPALATGLMWSAGNFCSIYATTGLGLSLGWPLVQCQLLVSATWAVFYFQEVQARVAKTVVMACSAVVLVGVFMLSEFGTNS